jgi:NRAMP (natural resistance-associated macrophage protein)-like metal ion transporter
MIIKSTYSDRKRRFFRLGPGALVTAAFIGPGTITTCSMAGAKFGYALLWGLVFSVVATIVLQEMSARLGIITQSGLGDALRVQFKRGFSKIATTVLVISAIVIGNASFQTGNILGASIGMQILTGNDPSNLKIWITITGAAAFIVLYTGNYKLIEKFLLFLVILMSITFLTTAIIIFPALKTVLKGMFIPAIPNGSLVTLIGLIGTTVVPYNLFLHASAVSERWKNPSGLSESRLDLFVSVVLGGLISMSIMITSAVAYFGDGNSFGNITDLATQLHPLLGKRAGLFTGLGYFAAGISSAITAPLAAAYAAKGILGWKRDLHDWRFRLVWMFILITGVSFSLLGFKPIEAIVFAQAANGILLPVIAVFLLIVMNNSQIMKDNKNKILSNLAGIVVVAVAVLLGIKSLLSVFHII